MSLVIFEALAQEQLADRLLAELAAEAPARGVLEPATVVVQNAGLGRWLRLRQARQCGISAGVTMPFARSFIAGMLEAAGLYERAEALDGPALAWQVFHLLSERTFEGWGVAGGPLQAYLARDRPALERRAWQLAQQVADLFDQYAIYRPEWLLAWRQGAQELPEAPHWGWQARLFESVAEKLADGAGDLERRIFGLALHRFCAGRGEPAEAGAPLHVFGISSFSPAFLRFFQRLAQSRPVKVYHLVCSEVFLGDLPKNYRQALLEEATFSGEAAALGADLNNPVLVASGQATARFQSLLLALDYGIGDQPEFVLEASASDLQALQDALRHNHGETDFRGDGSLSIHACHSRHREVQVLQQQLLALFAADPGLRPEEVMVLTPEITDYVDAIAAVFGEGTRIGDDEEPSRIPYCIADQRGSVDENCWRFLLGLLELLKGRQPFSQVAGLLDFQPVSERLQVSREELQELLGILQAAGVRWGIDAESRAAQGHPSFDAYSWERGLMRLYDGLIFPLAGQEERAPFPVSGRMAEVVGSLTQLLRPTFRLARLGGQPRSFAEWAEELLGVIRGLLSERGDGAAWMRSLALSLGSVKAVAAPVPIGFDTFCGIVEDSREEASGPTGLLRRGVTFCRLQPVRHIPAKVICILGLNEGEYPRQDRPAEFDLIDLQRRGAARWKGTPLALDEIQFLGDHRLREEDRQLFLDCVLNARQRLYLSYVGQSDKSNEPVPPSLLVSELVQFLERRPGADAEERAARAAAVRRIHLRHPLQEWSRRNFELAQPGRLEPPVPIHFERPLAHGEPDAATSFLDAVAGEDPGFEASTRATPADLVRFLEDPAEYYLKRRLQVDLDQLKWSEVHQDWEQLEADPLTNSNLRVRVFQTWTEALRRNEGRFSPERLRRRLEAEQALPPGLAGEAVWRQEVEPVLGCLAAQLEDQQLETERVERVFADLSLASEEVRLADGRALIVVRGALEGKYLLEAYLRHLLADRDSLVLCLKAQECFEVPVAAPGDDAERWLETVLAHWDAGQRAPLPFSLGIGLAYVRALEKARTAARPLNREALLTDAYRRHWSPYQGRGDDSPAQRLCFNGDSPAAPGSPWREAFAGLAESLLTPAVRWGEELRKGART